MGLDIYAGTLTRYYTRNWKTAVQQWSEQNNIRCNIITPNGEMRNENIDAEEVQHSVELWMEALTSGLSDKDILFKSWEENNEKEYYTDKPGWDGYGALVILSACLYSGKEVPKFYEKSSDWNDDPVVQTFVINESYTNPFLNGIEMWVPFEGCMSFSYIFPTGKEANMSTVEQLESDLQYMNKMRWNADEETILSWLNTEVASDADKDTFDFDALSKFAYCIFYKAVLFAKENKVPIRLDY